MVTAGYISWSYFINFSTHFNCFKFIIVYVTWFSKWTEALTIFFLSVDSLSIYHHTVLCDTNAFHALHGWDLWRQCLVIGTYSCQSSLQSVSYVLKFLPDHLFSQMSSMLVFRYCLRFLSLFLLPSFILG